MKKNTTLKYLNRIDQSGYSLLLSTVTIGIILLSISTVAAQSSFNARLEVLNRYNHAQARILEKACIDKLRLQLAKGENESNAQIIINNTLNCHVYFQTQNNDEKMIRSETKAGKVLIVRVFDINLDNLAIINYQLIN